MPNRRRVDVFAKITPQQFNPEYVHRVLSNHKRGMMMKIKQNVKSDPAIFLLA